MQRKHTSALWFLVVTLLAGGQVRPVRAQGKNPGIVPLQAKFRGLSYSEWSAKWWQWAWANLGPTTPLSDPTGAYASLGQAGNVWFLGWAAGPQTERTFQIPAGTALYIPATTWDTLAQSVFLNASLDELIADAQSTLGGTDQLFAEIDGNPVSHFESYQVLSTPFQPTLNGYNWLGLTAGKYGPDVAAGYFIMVEPLSVGNHTIHLSYDILPPNFFAGHYDIVNHIEVIPGKK